MTREILPFQVRWTDNDVSDVLDRVNCYPWPAVAAIDDGWAYGCDPAYLRSLCDYWTTGFDWRAAVDDLNRFPQFTARVGDLDLHFLHVVGEAKRKRPLLITHGWPGSHFEFWRVIEPLAYPSRFGGNASDAFDLVIPSLPGFGFSSKPARSVGPRATARLFNTLMTEVLGYETYLAQGGDWGGTVASWLGREHGASVRAINLNMLGLRPSVPPTSQDEQAWAKKMSVAQGTIGAYFSLQATKPQSIAWMGAGNPVGQAAWIAERFHDWSDLTNRSMDNVHPMDSLLTNIMIYVMTGSFTTAAWFYRGLIEEGGMTLPLNERCETPTTVLNFPNDALYTPPPRSYAEHVYNIVDWWDMPRGGHFAAMEEPQLYIDNIRSWGREVGRMEISGTREGPINHNLSEFIK
ncbi:pimeloyl-ACP methyl ester carboxylesterase [Rhizobium sp. PP-F2F-G48]|uniref:epoxide hydrolase family protein n=1 Tax=Rhizobium sp. PP-F2F-G48 TaxID=2135651 RepID=UPI001052E7E6|nr:epoxide hydrolase family protein [Rhizobium sp. PP-F2F-G48]TCM44691.1 pimeloyl-ACP methyl ester carboxylesterase [Rhizobium sp. PP-F2F-G48]